MYLKGKLQAIRFQRFLYHAWISYKFYGRKFQIGLKAGEQFSLYYEKS